MYANKKAATELASATASFISGPRPPAGLEPANPDYESPFSDMIFI